MQLLYAFFAEKADRLTDERLCIFGADSDTVEASRFPATFELALIIKLALLPDEPLEGHHYSIAVTNPAGKRVEMTQTPNPVKTKRNPYDPTLPSGASILINLGVKFDTPGCHQFHIVVDGNELRSVPLYVAKVQEQKQESRT